jgi:hypothetical protein
MTLIIEDGTQVANANTYVSDAEYVAYAAARGKTIASTADNREIQLIKSMDYIEAFRSKFKGDKVAQTQSLQWPRYNVEIDGFYIDSDVIPQELKDAEMEAAIYINSSEILISGTTQNIQREKLDKLEIAYFSGGSYEVTRTDTVDAKLDILLKNGSNGLNGVVTRA